MLKERRAAVDAVTSDFTLAEASAHMAASQGARTLAGFIEHRAALNLPLDFGLDALDALASGTSHAVASRRSFIEAHKAMRDLPAKMGLPTGYGPDCPPNEPFAPFKMHVVDAVG